VFVVYYSPLGPLAMSANLVAMVDDDDEDDNDVDKK
jgi:hypothetical protein